MIRWIHLNSISQITMYRIQVIALLLCAAINTFGASLDTHQDCDDSMKVSGGPCLEGVPTNLDKAVQGVIPVPHRQVLGFTVGVDSFAIAKKIFGPAHEWHSGDAAASETKLCYIANSGNDVVTVVLAENDEMATNIDEIRMIRGRIDSGSKCETLRQPLADIHTASGLRAGMTERQLESILGRPTYPDAGLLFYTWEKNRELKAREPDYSSCLVDGRSIETLGSGVTARVIRGVVVWITIVYGDYVC